MSGAFLGIESPWSSLPDSRFAVLKVPYDGTSTWVKGADRGPRAIIEASQQLELYDIETDSEPFREGIYTHDEDIIASSPGELVDRTARAIGDFLARGKVPVLLGGEHSVTIGAVRAASEIVPGLSVLQMDAHADLRSEYEGSPYNHACVMARVAEHCPSVQVGIRSMDSSEKAALTRERAFFADEIVGETAWIDRAVALLSDEVYLTFDLDVLDPSIMPATGTPEPGGLQWYDCLRFLRAVAGRKRIVGFDVVELCPPTEGGHASAFLAAKLIYKTMAYICAARPAAK